jgi:uncharacterized membrane protein YdbT with pleckstrin-like domain
MTHKGAETLTGRPSSAAGGALDAARFEAQPEQVVLWSASVGQVVNAGALVFGTLFAWLLLPALYAMWRMWQTANHRYTLTDQRLAEQRGIWLRDTQQLELYRVRDIAVVEPPLQRLFGRGQITLMTSDLSSPTVLLDAVAHPHNVAYLIRQRVEACRVAKGVRQIDG